MTEVQFEKRKKLTAEEVFACINEYGQLKLGSATSGIPINSQFVAEITGELIVEKSPTTDDQFYAFPVKYHCKGYEPEYVSFKVYVAESKANKLVNEKPDYVGKHCLFGKGRFNGKAFHVVAVLENAPEEQFSVPKKVAEVNKIASEATPTAPVVHEEYEIPAELQDWVKDALEQQEQFMKSFPTVSAFITYVNGPYCDTTWFAEQQDTDGHAAKVYYKIRNTIEQK